MEMSSMIPGIYHPVYNTTKISKEDWLSDSIRLRFFAEWKLPATGPSVMEDGNNSQCLSTEVIYHNICFQDTNAI